MRIEDVMNPKAYGFDEEIMRDTMRQNVEVEKKFLVMWILNLAKNTFRIRKRIIELFDLEPEGKFIVCGAGPSALDNLETLEKARARGWKIIAADRAYSILCGKGFRPDLCVFYDPSPAVVKFIHDDMRGGKYAVCLTCDGGVFDGLVGEDVYVYAPAAALSPFWRRAARAIPGGVQVIRCGTTVIFGCIDIALRMGAARIVLLGNELCWPDKESIKCAVERETAIQLLDGRWTRPSWIIASHEIAYFPQMEKHVDYVDCSGGIGQWPQGDIENILNGV